MEDFIFLTFVLSTHPVPATVWGTTDVIRAKISEIVRVYILEGLIHHAWSWPSCLRIL